MQAIGYIRVSTTKQVDTGLSLEAQRKAITAYCSIDDLELADIITDEGESAKSIAGRPGMRRLLALIEAGGLEHVVVTKMDRMFRNTREALGVFNLMAKRRVEFHSVREKIDTSTATGRFFRSMMLVMSEFERENTGERTSAVLRATKCSPGGSPILDHRKLAGKLLVGQAPYGFRWDSKDLLPHPQEMPVALRIRALRANGSTYRDIQRQLSDDGIATRMGCVWSFMTMRRIVQADYYPVHISPGDLQ